MVFGTPESQWDQYEDVYETMMDRVILMDTKKMPSVPSEREANGET
jgi:hypothetical protein